MSSVVRIRAASAGRAAPRVPAAVAAVAAVAALAALVLGCLGLGGCATLVPKLQAPHLTVNSVAFGGGDMAHQQIVLNLHVENPNAQRIAIRSIECHLDVAGTPFAQGQTETAVTLPALGATDFNVDVTADMNTALLALAGGLGHHPLNYRLYGEVHLAGGVIRNIPFDQNGSIRL